MTRVVVKNRVVVDRIRFIKYKGKEILFLDFSDITKEDGFEAILKAAESIKRQPDRSVLLLVDTTNAEFDHWLVREFECFIADNAYNIKKQAVVGIGELQGMFYDTIIGFLKRRSMDDSDTHKEIRGFPRFDDIEEAKEWLVSDEKYLGISFIKAINP